MMDDEGDTKDEDQEMQNEDRECMLSMIRILEQQRNARTLVRSPHE